MRRERPPASCWSRKRDHVVGVVSEHGLEVAEQPLEAVERQQAVVQDVEVVVLVLLDAAHLHDLGQHRLQQPDLVHAMQHCRGAGVGEDQRELGDDALGCDSRQEWGVGSDGIECLGHDDEAERRREPEHPQEPQGVLGRPTRPT